MGEAANRGTFDERREEAVLEAAEVHICVSYEGNKLTVQMFPRDEEPNQDSPAMILAGFINANLKELAEMAMEAKRLSETAVPVAAPAPGIVTDATPRIIGADGPATGEVRLVGPDGSTLQ
jgi:hypothetical protein